MTDRQIRQTDRQSEKRDRSGRQKNRPDRLDRHTDTKTHRQTQDTWTMKTNRQTEK